MRTVLFTLKVFVVEVLACLLTVHAAHAQPPARPDVTIEDIYQEATKRQALIHNIQVKYTVKVEQKLAIPQFPLGSKDGTREYETAYMGVKRLIRNDFDYLKSSNNKESTALYTGDQWFHYRPGVLETSRSKESDMESSDIYCRFILQVPLTDADQAQYDNAWFYPHVLRPIGGKSKYVLLPELEKVDDAWCLVVENPGFDKIWIDPKLQYMFRRRDRFENARGERVPLFSYKLRNFKMVSGVWVPMTCNIEHYVMPSQPREYWGKLYYEEDLVVDDIRINELTDKDFDFEVPAGTVWLTETGGRRLPGDKTALLTELGLIAQQHVSDDPGAPSSISWFVVLNIVAIGVVVAMLVLRLYRQRSENSRD